MATLIVTAHPDTGSLTHRAAQRVQELLPAGSTETAHLAQEGFDPRFTDSDRRAYLERRPAGPDVLAEQARVDRATDLVLVFPVWWWSMPALLKGWIDRVFIGGWAFTLDEADRVVPALGRLTAHLLPVSGTAAESFARHGYAQSFRTQVEHGVLDYCGVQRGATAFLWESESGDETAVARSLEEAATAIATAVGQRG
jgi:NAD(P)H dehydrogenase (quinone)